MRRAVEFKKYLKRKGKKDLVADDLVKRCESFEVFLKERHIDDIDDAREEDIMSFFDIVRKQGKGTNNYLRSISLYFGFVSKQELSALASSLREQRISSSRSPFKLKDFRGVGEEHIKLLEKEGIVNVSQMLEQGRNPSLRKELSKKTEIPLKSILEYVKLSDLSRIGALKSVRARLYFDAGVDTPDKVASWHPEQLEKMLKKFIKETGFKGIAPLPKEVKNAVETARRIVRIVEYD